MRVRVYLSGNAVHDRVLRAFYDGCGESKELVEGWQYEPSDVAVVFGVFKKHVALSIPRGQIIEQQRKNNQDVVVLETGYINRGDGENHHYAAGWNGLNGRADFRKKGKSADRKRLLGLTPKAWNHHGSEVLLCGQVPWDASVDHTEHVAWLHMAAWEITSRGFKCVFRPHPLGKVAPIKGCEYDLRPIKEAFADRPWSVVTFNSNSAVEALIDGLPAFAFDEGSMAWDVCNKTWDALRDPVKPERDRWLSELCYCQWTLDEMREGKAWGHLFR